jgi:hypothetical protein
MTFDRNNCSLQNIMISELIEPKRILPTIIVYCVKKIIIVFR